MKALAKAEILYNIKAREWVGVAQLCTSWTRVHFIFSNPLLLCFPKFELVLEIVNLLSWDNTSKTIRKYLYIANIYQPPTLCTTNIYETSAQITRLRICHQPNPVYCCILYIFNGGTLLFVIKHHRVLDHLYDMRWWNESQFGACAEH